MARHDNHANSVQTYNTSEAGKPILEKKFKNCKFSMRAIQKKKQHAGSSIEPLAVELLDTVLAGDHHGRDWLLTSKFPYFCF
jgi:uncharacterized protein YkuJ